MISGSGTSEYQLDNMGVLSNSTSKIIIDDRFQLSSQSIEFYSIASCDV